MKKLILLLSIALGSTHCYCQQLEFQLPDIYNLFNKNPATIKKYLNDKGYYFTKTENGFNFYNDAEGDKVKVCYKNAGMSLFSFTIQALYMNLMHVDLLNYGYTMANMQNIGEEGAFMASFHHSDGLHMCSLIRSPYNLDFIVVSFSNRK